MKQEEMAPTELAKMTIVYAIPEMEAVTVRHDVPYRTTEAPYMAPVCPSSAIPGRHGT